MENIELLHNIIKNIKEPEEKYFNLAQEKLNNLTKPIGSLGRLEELAKKIVGITREIKPVLDKKNIFVMVADHGVTEEKISAYPKEVTSQMVFNFINGGAAINVLSKLVNAEVIIVDMGTAADFDKNLPIINRKINYGTKNMAQESSMTYKEAVDSIITGIELVEDSVRKGTKIIGTGDMGIGNTTASSAITSVITETTVEDVTGYGTGLDEEGLQNKIKVIKKAINLNNPNPKDGLDVLSKLGGFEIGGIAGLIIGAAYKKIPVIIDGFISGAGALIAQSICPTCVNYMIASHLSVEKGHKEVLKKLNIKPLFDLDMRLGEGTGAALGMFIAQASINILNEMATFSEAGVSKKNN